jgi:radical SAM protein with 4Fe4S-binding SPASM domain
MYFDPSITRKKNIVSHSLSESEKLNGPLPAIIEISESGMCNRTCSFCPRSDPDYNHVNEFISFMLIEKLGRELKDLSFKNRILFSGFVEPLLDKNLFEKIKLLKEYLPFSKIELNTNGDVLNMKRLKKLFDNGLDVILVSVYDSKEDADKFEKLCLDANLKDDQFVIRHRYYSEEKDFGITLSNRAGMMKNAEFKIDTLSEPLDSPCYYPSYTFFLDYQGDVLMCPHDWGKKLILGNLNKSKFSEIWYSKKAIFIRKKLNAGDRKIKPCDICDVKGTYIGKEFAEVWDRS